MISLTSPVRTRAHDWPAGAKLAGLCLISTGLFLTDSPVVQALALALVLGLYALPGRDFARAGLAALRLVWPFVAVVLVWHALTDDLRGGLVIALRMTSLVALANLVTMTTALDRLTDLLHRLLAPLRRLGLPTHLLETAIALVIRFTPVLVQRAQHLVAAWRARALRRPGWRLILPLTLQALDEADHVGEALRARGGPLPFDEQERTRGT
ncbi:MULTISPECIES: CbiQ family ECF transporter T component [unclassified Paracoccus (in: a-proteobacteria)]|uniref:CbiQ family ECF transporter T component n=1 Tax=unclassified Paracoccus (in: a-proteobacteria) TaxID=2688777 RepID=UPI0012B1912B|nr:MULTISPECIES: CbiQ family ECF transporter T component [unclassified Paracoccus (in: a-proteobacteria)]UXU76587.1 energy-coupling factor transporter transmembrane protein EcfT [Paracoccus sp. SMMA_5]UXU82474.1 energy-coupling factor transporter transmembrane protein EcfT [Paracoccus sp. SMMA_5_TC]